MYLQPWPCKCLPLHPGAPPCNVDMAAWAPAVVKVACIPEASMSDKYNDHTCGSDVSWSNGPGSASGWPKQSDEQLTSDGHFCVKMMIGHESKKYYRPHAAWRGRNNPFFALPVCSSSKATRSQPNIFDTTAVEAADRQWGPSQATWKKMLLHHLHIYPALSLGPFDLLGCLKFSSAMLFWVPNLLKYKLAASHSLTRPFCKKPSD